MKLALLSGLMFCAVAACAGDTPPKAARSVHLHYPAPEGSVYYNEVTVLESQNGSYFCVCGFNHGYFGIQQLGATDKKIVIFSVWDSQKENDPSKVTEEERAKIVTQGEGVKITRFGGEGSGAKSIWAYDWKLNQPYKCMVRATVKDKWTTYAAYFYLPEQKTWKHLATLSTITGGAPLKGFYSFVEDFRRDGASVTQARCAEFANGWVKTNAIGWTPLLKATFTGDDTPLENIDSGPAANGFYLATGGTTQASRKLNSHLERLPAGLELPE